MPESFSSHNSLGRDFVWTFVETQWGFAKQAWAHEITLTVLIESIWWCKRRASSRVSTAPSKNRLLFVVSKLLTTQVQDWSSKKTIKPGQAMNFARFSKTINILWFRFEDPLRKCAEKVKWRTSSKLALWKISDLIRKLRDYICD